MLQKIRVVLVRAENPVNIGQSARAMRNFGASELALVNCAPHQVQEAYSPGWRGKEILDQSKVFNSVTLALKGFDLAVGFTARSGRSRGKPRWLMDLVPQIVETLQSGKVALVFGNEKNGLSNEELSKCHQIAMIPTDIEYSSLNLSHAVSIVLFSIYAQIFSRETTPKISSRYFATSEEFQDLMNDFREVLITLGYNNEARRGVLDRTLSNLRNYFKKSGLDLREFHLFKAFFARIQNQLTKQMPTESHLMKGNP